MLMTFLVLAVILKSYILWASYLPSLLINFTFTSKMKHVMEHNPLGGKNAVHSLFFKIVTLTNISSMKSHPSSVMMKAPYMSPSQKISSITWTKLTSLSSQGIP